MSAFLHASRRRERQARRTVTLIAAVVATRWICADLAVAWPIQAASVVGFAVGIAELVRGES
jgi:hypothetical protein